MICRDCGNEAYVLKHSGTDYSTTRVYRCKHGHETTTIEVLPSGVSKRDLAAAERGAKRAAELWTRNQAILKDLSTLPAERLGKKWNLTGARIRQLRDTVPTITDTNGIKEKP